MFHKYDFTLTSTDVAKINYENNCFVISFGLELNQWGYVHYCGIGIGVKKTKKEYWLGYILQELMKDKNFNFEKATAACIEQSPRGMLDLEAHRIVWDPYIADTFKDCEPSWEQEIVAFARSI